MLHSMVDCTEELTENLMHSPSDSNSNRSIRHLVIYSTILSSSLIDVSMTAFKMIFITSDLLPPV